MRGDKTASLLEVDGIARDCDFGTGLLLNTEVDSPSEFVKGMLRSALICVIHSRCVHKYTASDSKDVSFQCAIDAVHAPGCTDSTKVEGVTAPGANVDAIIFSLSCMMSCTGCGGGGCAV